MSDSDNEIFEMENTKLEVITKPKKEKVKLSQDRIDKLRLQLKTAREAKLKKKESQKDPAKSKVEPTKIEEQSKVIEQPTKIVEQPAKIEEQSKVIEQPTKTPVVITKKERKPRVKKEDKTELLLREIQGLKLEMSNLKNIPSPKVETAKITEPVYIAQSFQQPIIRQPFSLFKTPIW
jgi:hypothetical protein